ncbi:transposase, Ptta/En/Spm, plant [Spatholobus suberectus]|nr:transposase, Ptta/En/Spm, plant [Spatholobus suberectus]
MRQKRKALRNEMLERLRGQQDQNDREIFKMSTNSKVPTNQLDDQFANVDINDSSNHDTFDPSLSPNEAHQSQQKEDPLLVKANQVWHLEKTKKVIVEINGNGQGNDNGSNLLVRILGKLDQNSIICPISVERWDWMPKKQSEQNTTNCKKLKVSHAGGSRSNARRGRDIELQLGRLVCRSEIILSTLLKKDGNYVNEEGKVIADKISENLSKDQERAATLGVPSKVNAYPDDAIGKVYGVEHSGQVRGLGVGSCPTNVFGTRRHFTDFVNVGSSSQKDVEALQKQVETLDEKLSGCEETKKQLEILQNFLQHKLVMSYLFSTKVFLPPA